MHPSVHAIDTRKMLAIRKIRWVQKTEIWMSTVQAQAAGLPINWKEDCLLCVFTLFKPQKPSFLMRKKRKRIWIGHVSLKSNRQTRKTIHEHESTAEFSVTPLFAGAAWREAVETAVCVNEKVYCVQSTGQRIRTFTFGVTTMEDPTQQGQGEYWSFIHT